MCRFFLRYRAESATPIRAAIVISFDSSVCLRLELSWRTDGARSTTSRQPIAHHSCPHRTNFWNGFDSSRFNVLSVRARHNEPCSRSAPGSPPSVT